MEGLKSFKCPICLEFPDKEIFQCKNGHSVCHNCVANSSSHCPQCQVPYRLVKVRNCALESLLDSVDFECTFKVVGCTQTCKRGELKEHIRTCDFSRRNILLCKMTGYETCQFIPSGYSRAEILEHFGGYHDEDVFIHNGNCAHIRFADIVTVAKGVGDFWWSPVLINYENNETGPLFLILSSSNAKENLTSLMCVLLWADEQANNVLNLFADFSLKSVTGDVPDFKLTLPAVHIQQVKSFLEDGIPWKVSTSFLIQHYLSATEGGRDVVFEVTLTRRDEPKVKIESGELVQTSVFGSRRKRAELNTSQTNANDLGASTSQTLVLDRAPIPSTSSFNISSQSQTPLPGEYIFDDRLVIVTCDSCNLEPIHGIRYKCTQCANYDLCSNCVQQGGHHDQHIFVLIRNAVQNKELVRWQDRATSKTPKLLSREAEPMDEDASEITTSKDFTCEKCSKKTTMCERLYRCLTCADCFICSNCINQDQHSQKHFFAMTRDWGQYRLLHENRRSIAAKLRCQSKRTGCRRRLATVSK